MVARSRKTPSVLSVADRRRPSPRPPSATRRPGAGPRRSAASSRQFRELLGFPLDEFQVDACLALERGSGVLVAAPTGAGKTVVGEFAVHLALAVGPQGVLHDADQGALQPEVRRPGPPLRRREGRSAHGRHDDQRRRARRRHDHRGAAQHAVRGLVGPAGPRVRRHGRGALPRRPVPRPRLGGGDHPPHRRRAARLAVRHRVQRRGVRRLAGHRARRHHRGGERAPTRPARPARPGTRRPARPVRRARRPDRPGRRPADQPRPEAPAAAQQPRGRPVSLGADRGDRGRRRGGRAGPPGGGAGRRPGSPSSTPSTATGCCPRSSSSSPAAGARAPSSSASRRACG